MTDLSGLRTLYISYNGMGEPLVRSQVLNYQERLTAMGLSADLLTFEKISPENEAAIRAELAAHGIQWSWLPYNGHRCAKGSLRDVAAGMREILKRRGRIDFVHARSFIPALMAYTAKLRGGPDYLYDVRGFFAHEKRYKGRIKSDAQFRVVRWLEGRLYKGASAIVTLTAAAMRVIERDYLGANPDLPRAVIPTCVDLSRYEGPRRPLDPEAPRLVYSGSLGAGYLPDEVFRFFAVVRDTLPKATLEILTRSDASIAAQSAAKAGLTQADYTLRSLTPAEMPAALKDCDAALSLIAPDFSKIASCPTKMAEYLAAGLVVVANGEMIGDVGEQLRTTGAGITIDEFGPEAISNAAGQMIAMLHNDRQLCRAQSAAADLFSLASGVEQYAALYSSFRARF